MYMGVHFTQGHQGRMYPFIKGLQREWLLHLLVAGLVLRMQLQLLMTKLEPLLLA